MRTLPTKNIFLATILAGVIFFAVGVSFAEAAVDPLLAKLDCGIPVPYVDPEASLIDCIPIGVYYLFYIPLSFILAGSGYIFDTILTLSIDSQFISQEFIDTSWKIVRDFSNMIFIFILLYTGIETMLRAGTDWRGTVLKVIIVALLINFSLFFTKVVIDAGNILAVSIYNTIGQPSTGSDNHINPSYTGTISLQQRDVSTRLVEAFKPQSFITVASDVEPLNATIVFIVAGVVSAFAGYVLFMSALLFAGRLIGFWFLMIISPFAFISITFPKGNKFGPWLSTLLGLSFVAPVFLFLIYLIIQVINAGVLDGLIADPSTTSKFTFDKVLSPVIIAVLIIAALKGALGFAKDMSGKFGEIGSGLVGGALGVVAGVATGGVALAGQKSIGRLARYATESEGFKEAAAKSGIASVAYNLTDKTANASFDARNVPGGDKLGLGKLGLGKGSDGSFVKTVQQARAASEALGQKISTGKDGKPIMTKYDAIEYKTGPSGERIATTVKREGTTAQAYAERMSGGTIAGVVTGANIGMAEVAKNLEKKEQKRIKLDKKKKTDLADYKEKLGVKEKLDTGEDNPLYKLEIDDERIEALKDKVIEDHQLKVAKAEADLSYLKDKDPGDTSVIAMAVVQKLSAERALKKFESMQSNIERVQKELKELEGKKEEKG